MPEISITFGQHQFVWEASEAEAARLHDEQHALWAANGIPLESILAIAPRHLGDPDPNRQRGARVMLTAWALAQPAQHPDLQGRVLDFLPTHDFSFALTVTAPGKAAARIEARPRHDYSGTA